MAVSGFACIINLLEQLSHFVEKQYLSKSKFMCRQKLRKDLVIIMEFHAIKQANHYCLNDSTIHIGVS